MRHNRPTGSYRPFMIAALTGIALTLSGQTLASSPPGWQPQISEKILVLPQKQLERAIQRDFAASPLASDMMNVDQQISSEITNIQSLSENQHLYEGEAAIEVKHQVLAAKRAISADGRTDWHEAQEASDQTPALSASNAYSAP